VREKDAHTRFPEGAVENFVAARAPDWGEFRFLALSRAHPQREGTRAGRVGGGERERGGGRGVSGAGRQARCNTLADLSLRI